MNPIMVEVVAYAPTGFYHCTHCEIIFKEQGIGDKIHAEQLQSAMPEDLLRDYAQVSRWVNTLVDRFGERVAVKVIDAASIEGVWKSMRHGLRRYPVAIIAGAEKVDLSDGEAAGNAVARHVVALQAEDGQRRI